jgi:NADH-quinone oxidoreductase subunit E
MSVEAVFSDEVHAHADRIVARYPQPRSALLPLLYLVQSEQGVITKDGLAFCAEKVGITKAEAQSTETYYEMYEHDDPGDWLITVCRNFSCKVRGSHDVLHRLEELLGGERDPEAGIAVKEMECLGNCEGAPVVQVNYNNYERVTLEQAEAILEGCRRGEPPATVNGQVPETFREVCRRLAGVRDAEILHEAAVRAVQADMVDYPEPPAERILEADKPLGATGVHPPGAEVGDVGEIEPDLGPTEAREARLEAEDIPSSEEQPIGDRGSDPDEPSTGEEETEEEVRSSTEEEEEGRDPSEDEPSGDDEREEA